MQKKYHKSKKRLSKHIKLKKYSDKFINEVFEADKEISEILEMFNHLSFNDIKMILRLSGWWELSIKQTGFNIVVNDKEYKVNYFISDNWYIGTQADLGVHSQGKNLKEVKKMMQEVIELTLEVKNEIT